jgi:hypothetical protein
MQTSDRSPTPAPRRQVGYFCHVELGSRHVGAILVTDPIGVPVEFKYTDPVVTTKLHQILYGASLERYLHETVIRERLSREVHSEPEFFIAPYEEREYLGKIAGREMVAVQSIDHAPVEGNCAFTQLREREAIVRLEEGPALRLAFSTLDDATQRRIAVWLQEFSRSMDVLEPLDRIVRALKTICGEEKRVAAAS